MQKERPVQVEQGVLLFDSRQPFRQRKHPVSWYRHFHVFPTNGVLFIAGRGRF